jgi:hypothetical protein
MGDVNYVWGVEMDVYELNGVGKSCWRWVLMMDLHEYACWKNLLNIPKTCWNNNFQNS